MAASGDEKNLLDLLRQLELPPAGRRKPATTLTGAACEGNVALVTAFLDIGENIEERSVGFASPLQAACNGDHLEVVDVLLKRGAQTGHKKDAVFSPLRSGIPYLRILKRLIEAGADINAEPDLIIIAAMSGYVEQLTLLLKYEAQAKRGAYALFKAAKANHLACVKVLMDFGAAKLDEQTFNNTLADAKAAQNQALVDLLEGRPVADAVIAASIPPPAQPPRPSPIDIRARAAQETEAVALIKKMGDKVKAIKAPGKPLLFTAAANNLALAVGALIEAGVEIDASPADGQTALLIVAERGFTALAQKLVAAGANVNAKNNYNYTALHFAAGNGDLELVKTLLAAGAKPDAKGKDKRTPLQCACGVHVKAMKALLESTSAGGAKKKKK